MATNSRTKFAHSVADAIRSDRTALQIELARRDGEIKGLRESLARTTEVLDALTIKHNELAREVGALRKRVRAVEDQRAQT
jgi:hypothetical protein